jgi:hypothetical protein
MKWYMLNKIGMATLCINEEDAIQCAKDADIACPDMAPHIATLMMPVDKKALRDLENAVEECDMYHGWSDASCDVLGCLEVSIKTLLSEANK